MSVMNPAGLLLTVGEKQSQGLKKGKNLSPTKHMWIKTNMGTAVFYSKHA